MATATANMKTTTSDNNNNNNNNIGIDSIIELIFHREPLSTGLSYYNYGTAGFRFKADIMDGLMVRVGILSTILLLKQSDELLLKSASAASASSAAAGSGSAPAGSEAAAGSAAAAEAASTNLSTGVMITASHNDETYNGVKLANPDGSMLIPSQEEFLTKWVNESDSKKWKSLLLLLVLESSKNELLLNAANNMNNVLNLKLHIGRDTRSHSSHLSKLLIEGAQTFIDYYYLSSSSSSSSSSSTDTNTDTDTVKIKICVLDHGVLTTPMLHHIVLHSNPDLYLPSYIEPKPTRKGYIETYANAYIDLCNSVLSLNAKNDNANANNNNNNNMNKNNNNDANNDNAQQPQQQQTVLRIDSACGVGYDAVKELENEIYTRYNKYKGTRTNTNTNTSTAMMITSLNAKNGQHDGPLNDSCGSDHVKTLFQPPIWWNNNNDNNNDNNNNEDDADNNFDYPYCCSLDGDADRIVFFGQKSKNELSEFLDGDKIAILIAHVLQDKLSKVTTKTKTQSKTISSSTSSSSTTTNITPPKMGIIQTAYANGAATNYVRDVLKLPVIITKTGVKHLHHAAVENFDIGIYFEANGHGTVVFSKQYEQFAIEQANDDENKNMNGKNPFFIGLHRLINPAVGDALCDMLLVDYLLRSLGTNNDDSWTLQDWNTKLYQDLPNRMLKVKVKDRTIIKCNSNESICLQPLTVQPLLENAMNNAANGIENGRCFIRPSGTEDIVRVYAEAKTRIDADKLALIASQIVYDECNGIGERP